MNFIKKQNFLKDSEKEFFWSLANKDNNQTLIIFRSLKEIKNIVIYSIYNRLEHHLLEFLDKNKLSPNINKSYLMELKNSAEFRAKKSLITYDKALSFLDDLTNHKINYISLKGISYLEYSKSFKRPIRDIDILVEKKDIEKAVHIAFEHGFRFQNHNAFSKSMLVKNSEIYDLPDLIDNNKICLEIHYKVLIDKKNNECLLSKKMLEEKRAFSIHGKNIQTTNLYLHIAHLIFHSSKKGNFDVGIGSVFDFIYLTKFLKNDCIKKVIEISNLCNFSLEAKTFFEIFIDDPSKKNIMKFTTFKELIFSPNLNTKIQEVFLEKSFLNKVKKIYLLVFVRKDYLKREFNIDKNHIAKVYILRWVRQFKQFNKYLYLILFNSNDFKRKSILIKRFYQ